MTRKRLLVLVAVVAMAAGVMLSPAGALAGGEDYDAFADRLMRMNDREVRRLRPCLGIPPTIIGTPGDDVIWGTPGDDVIFGRAGDDVIYGGQGVDIICGGSGNDIIWGQGGPITFLAGANGDDVLKGGGGSDFMWGGRGSDILRGRGGDDFLHAGDGGSAYDDTRNGGAGFDECVPSEWPPRAGRYKNCESVPHRY